MEQINNDFSQEQSDNNINQKTPKSKNTFFLKFSFKSVISGVLVLIAFFSLVFVGKKTFSFFSLLRGKKEITSKDIEISFTILDIRDVLKFYSKEIPFAEYSVIEFPTKYLFWEKKDVVLYIDRGIVKLGLDFTDIPETALVVDKKKKKIVINYPISLDDKFIVNVITDYSSSEYHSVSDSFLTDSSEARQKENEIHHTLLKRVEEKYRTQEYLNEVKREVKERLVEYFALFSPEYAVEINL